MEIKKMTVEEFSKTGIKSTSSIFHNDFFINKKTYTLRFPIFAGWGSDEQAEEEMNLLACLCPADSNFKDADVFITIKLGSTSNHDDLSEEGILKEIEDSFIEDGWHKDVHLSSMKTYDNCLTLVVTYEDLELKYVRKNLFFLVKGEPRFFIFGFQVNNLDKQQIDFLFTMMEGLIKGCKIAEIDQDRTEYCEYIESLVQRGILK